MRTSGKEFFYSIQGMIVPKKEVDDLLNENLDFFVDWIQNNIGHLPFLFEHHIELFVYEMKIMAEMLDCIYAKWLRQDASRILVLADARRDKVCRKLLEPFMVSAQTLAIDIQMAQNNRAPEGDHSENNEVVDFKDIVSSMKIVLELLEQSDFDKAFQVALDIIQLQDPAFSRPFMEDMASKDVGRLKELASGIITLYTGKIDDINDSGTKPAELKKIMVVDDMPEILNTLSKMLKDHYKIYPFSDPRRAVDFMDNVNRPDAFLLDIDMPDMDGFELAGCIRERKQYKHTPLIFLTGDSARETVEKSLTYDAKAFFVKPANKDIILAKLRECLK